MGYLVDINLRFFGDPIKSAFSFLFLDLKGDSLDWSTLDSLHEMGSESCDFISQAFGGDFSNLREDLLVDVEVVGQFLIVFL